MEVLGLIIPIVIFSGLWIWVNWWGLQEERRRNRHIDERQREADAPHVQKIVEDEHVPEWVAKVRLEQKRDFRKRMR